MVTIDKLRRGCQFRPFCYIFVCLYCHLFSHPPLSLSLMAVESEDVTGQGRSTNFRKHTVESEIS